jgi:cyclase
MVRPRIIPVLLLKGKGLVKGIQYKDHAYVGDPINAIQIFNSKEADEILFLDITATSENRSTSPEFIQSIADQCLMPFGIGGGISNMTQVQCALRAGAEKVCINTAALEQPKFIKEIASHFGSQSVMVSIDYRVENGGKLCVYTQCGKRRFSDDLVGIAKHVEDMGAGEIVLTCIDREGTGTGYDLETLGLIRRVLTIPIIVNGGAGNYSHFREAFKIGNADAAAAGSLFLFHGRRRAVLISYPENKEIEELTR